VLLQKLTKLTALRLDYVAEAEALEHLGGLTRLQDLSIAVTPDDWAVAGCPGLQDLKALTRLYLSNLPDGMSASVSQLTALQRLGVQQVGPTALNKLSALTWLTRLGVGAFQTLRPGSPPLQLSGLRHLEVVDGWNDTLPMSFLASCTQLRILKPCDIILSPGPAEPGGQHHAAAPGALQLRLDQYSRCSCRCCLMAAAVPRTRSAAPPHITVSQMPGRLGL